NRLSRIPDNTPARLHTVQILQGEFGCSVETEVTCGEGESSCRTAVRSATVSFLRFQAVSKGCARRPRPDEALDLSSHLLALAYRARHCQGDRCNAASLAPCPPPRARHCQGDRCNAASLAWGDRCNAASLGDRCNAASLAWGDRCNAASLGEPPLWPPPGPAPQLPAPPAPLPPPRARHCQGDRCNAASLAWGDRCNAASLVVTPPSAPQHLALPGSAAVSQALR
ncbi:unnamed protein product, partial [Lepidochelys kempii]